MPPQPGAPSGQDSSPSKPPPQPPKKPAVSAGGLLGALGFVVVFMIIRGLNVASRDGFAGNHNRSSNVSAPVARPVPTPVDTSDWPRITSTDKRFTGRMPGRARAVGHNFGSEAAPIPGTQQRIDANEGMLVFAYGESDPLPASLIDSPADLKAALRAGLLAEFPLSAERNEKIRESILKKADNHTVYQFAYTSSSKVLAINARCWVVGDRVYRTLTGTMILFDASPMNEAFHASFALQSPIDEAVEGDEAPASPTQSNL